MRKMRDVLRYQHSTDLSLEAIARELNISEGIGANSIGLKILYSDLSSQNIQDGGSACAHGKCKRPKPGY